VENVKIDVEQIAPCVRRLTIEVPTDRVDRELEIVYRDLQRRVKLPGFRPGRVPRRILENHYRSTVEHEVLQKLVPEALSATLRKENLHVVGEPQIEHMVLTKGQPLRFVATVQVIPDFELADYHGWKFERRIPAVTEADVDRVLAQVRERHAALEAVSGRPVQEGDFVLVDYRGFVDERPLPGMEENNVVLEVGAGVFPPEIEQGLVGMAQGAEKIIPVRLPENYREAALAGRVVHFWIKVTEIKQKVLPELDDDFARAYEDADSLAALRERLRGELEEAARKKADEALRSEILAKLVAENPIDVPEVLVQEQMRRLYLRHKRQETGRELTEADYQVEPDSLRETFAEPALEAVRGQVILHRLGEEFGVVVAPEEVDAEVASLASRTAQNPEALKKAMERNGALGALETSLRERKIFEAIMASVQIADKRVSAETAAPDA
jgi:trigger factor